MLLGFHAQSCNAGGLAVRVHVEIVRVDAGGSAEQAAHVRLSHVSPGAGNTQEVRHPAGRVGVRSHAGGNGVAGDNTAWNRRRSTAATEPRRVLDLEEKSSYLKRLNIVIVISSKLTDNLISFYNFLTNTKKKYLM